MLLALMGLTGLLPGLALAQEVGAPTGEDTSMQAVDGVGQPLPDSAPVDNHPVGSEADLGAVLSQAREMVAAGGPYATPSAQVPSRVDADGSRPEPGTLLTTTLPIQPYRLPEEITVQPGPVAEEPGSGQGDDEAATAARSASLDTPARPLEQPNPSSPPGRWGVLPERLDHIRYASLASDREPVRIVIPEDPLGVGGTARSGGNAGWDALGPEVDALPSGVIINAYGGVIVDRPLTLQEKCALIGLRYLPDTPSPNPQAPATTASDASPTPASRYYEAYDRNIAFGLLPGGAPPLPGALENWYRWCRWLDDVWK